MKDINTSQLGFIIGLLLGSIITLALVSTLKANNSFTDLGTRHNPMYVKIVKW